MDRHQALATIRNPDSDKTEARKFLHEKCGLSLKVIYSLEDAAAAQAAVTKAHESLADALLHEVKVA